MLLFKNKELLSINSFFHDAGSCHIETSSLIWKANKWTGFYMTESSFVKELIHVS